MAQMMFCTTIVLLLLPVSAFSVDINDAYNYIFLIKDIHNYYQTTCIIIVHSDTYTDFNQTSLAYIWSRTFSQRGIMTLIISFSELSREARKYQGYITRPLYVVVLATKKTVDEFSMVIRQIDISLSVWLMIFLSYEENPMLNVCQNPAGNLFNVMYDTEMLVLCYNLPFLNEWYALRSNETRIFNLATWRSGQAINLRTKRSLYHRRNNMFGKTMRVSIVEESLFIAQKNGVLSLFLGEVMQELSESMNFTIEVVSSMSAYGSWDKEEEIWTGVMGEVASNRVDFGVAEFSMTNSRLDVVDFTLPLILSRYKIYFKKPDGSTVDWSAYFKTFNADIWATIIFLILTTPILLTIIKTRGGFAMQILADNYIYVWGIYCQQGLSEFPNESSMRLAFLSIFVSALIILSAYSASLISFLTVYSISLPFSTIEGFATYGSYGLIVFRNSADYDTIISANDSTYSRVKRLLKKKEDLPVTVNEAFTQVCTERVGFYVTEVIRNAITSLPCETVYIEANKVDSLAIILGKASPYTRAVNYHLQRFKDTGVLNKIRNMFLVTAKSGENTYATVTLRGIAPILAVLAGGILLSCFVLILEKIYYNLWGSKWNKTSEFASWKEFFERELNISQEEKVRHIQNLAKDLVQVSKK
ncbi:Glutamate receptor ionotropic, delta-2 [Anthophora quadrimaculata]